MSLKIKHFQGRFPGYVEAQIFWGEIKCLHISTLLLKPNTCVCRPWVSHVNFQIANYHLQKKQLYEIKYSSIGPSNCCRLYSLQALLKSYLWNVSQTGFWKYIYVQWLPSGPGNLVVIAACHWFQNEDFFIFFLWEQAVNGNKFTQRVTHSHQKLLSAQYYIMNIVSSLILDHLSSILLFHLEVHLL